MLFRVVCFSYQSFAYAARIWIVSLSLIKKAFTHVNSIPHYGDLSDEVVAATSFSLDKLQLKQLFLLPSILCRR